MSKRLLAIISAICILCSLASCGNSEDSDTLEISETESSSSELTSSENDSSETDSSEDESSEVEKVTTKTPKKVEDSSSEDDNFSKVTTTKKTETPKTTTTTKTTQAPVTQIPKTTTKTTTTTKKTTAHTHRWVKAWDDGEGTICYLCSICRAEKHERSTITTTTTKVQPTSKTVQPNEWIPVYSKTLVTHTIGDGYEKIIDANGYAKPGKKVEFVSKTYWNEAAANRGDATEIAKRTKAQDEARAFCNRDDIMNDHWVSSGNDHYIDVPDKYNIAFYYYKDSNGKYAVWWGSNRPSTMTESDLAKSEAYNNTSIKTDFKNAYFTGTPWA